MKSQSKSYATEEAAGNAAKIKTLAWRLAINHRNLKSEIKRAFDLAKSAGKELDLTFIPEAT